MSPCQEAQPTQSSFWAKGVNRSTKNINIYNHSLLALYTIDPARSTGSGDSKERDPRELETITTLGRADLASNGAIASGFCD